MHIRFSLFLVLLVPLAVGLTSYADRNAYQDNSEERVGRSIFSMIKRGNEVLKGTVARKQILFGSTKVSSYRSKGYNGATLYRYTKSGNWNQAKRDFCAVKPTNVERGGKGHVQVGTIGDKKIKLTQNGPFDLPTIKIYTSKTKGSEQKIITEEIFYINRPTELGTYSYFDI